MVQLFFMCDNTSKAETSTLSGNEKTQNVDLKNASLPTINCENKICQEYVFS